MSAPVVPSIPPRPARGTREHRLAAPENDNPPIPPRPVRQTDRSVSPQRHSFAQSPLNELKSAVNGGSLDGALHDTGLDASSSNLPPRPPSVTLPSIGQEGSEYAGFYGKPLETSDAVDTDIVVAPATRNVGRDLELHAPKPGLPTSSAKARIATVTRTDSTQAAAAGIGKVPEDDKDPHMRSLRAKTSFASSQNSSGAMDRVSSTQPTDGEQGIPEIGQRVPMYPDAGDVQAPSPSPFAPSSFGSGQAYPEGQYRAARHHGRTRSGRESFHGGPPGSYGLHGHGTPINDRFEKAWYDKHPDALEREEHGEYGPGIGGGRGAWALSREDLDRIVRETASRGAGVGTSPAVLGTPHEEIGYMASEEYTAKLASSRPPSTLHHHKTQSNASQNYLDSPLKKSSFPTSVTGEDGPEKSPEDSDLARNDSDHAVESEGEDNVIHVDPPAHRTDRIGGGGYDPPTEDLGPHGGNTAEEGGWLDERGYGVPILASDEVGKEPGAEFLHPAVSPPLERSGGELYGGWESEQRLPHTSGLGRTVSRGSSASVSRANSRPASISGLGAGLSRFVSLDEREDISTPLEDVEEYEPLFPEGEDESNGERSAAEPLSNAKRKSLLRYKFPSKDIWEDAPSSAQLQATVSGPALPDEDARTVVPDREDDSRCADDNATRPDESNVQNSGTTYPNGNEKMTPHIKTIIYEDLSYRPGMKQRFPSRDIWEDTPASLQLQTVVSTPQVDEVTSPPEVPERPVGGVSARTAQKSMSAAEAQHGDGKMTAARGLASENNEKPIISIRPAKTQGTLKEMAGQPSVPPRPPKTLQQDVLSETPPLADENERSTGNQPGMVPVVPASDTPGDGGVAIPQSPRVSDRKAPVLPERPKPQVPARPAKPATKDVVEGVPLAKTTSAASVTSTSSVPEDAKSSQAPTAPPAPRSKPAVPARPHGGKIASLKAGFMSDLEKRLQSGPQAPKAPEKIVEGGESGDSDRAPLSDARKGRARGPVRRGPAASSSGTAVVRKDGPSMARVRITPVSTIWQISGDGRLNVASHHQPPLGKPISDTAAGPGQGSASASSTVGQSVNPTPGDVQQSTSSERASSTEERIGRREGPSRTVGSKDIATRQARLARVPTASSQDQDAPPDESGHTGAAKSPSTGGNGGEMVSQPESGNTVAARETEAGVVGSVGASTDEQEDVAVGTA